MNQRYIYLSWDANVNNIQTKNWKAVVKGNQI